MRRAAYLLLMLLLLLLTGLRSAEVREPRCLCSPSPPPRIGNNLGFNASPLPAPSPLITLTPPSSSSSPPAQQTCRFFGSPPAATPPLLPILPLLLLVSVIHHSSPQSHYFLLYIYFLLPLAVTLLFSDPIQVYVPLQRCHIVWKHKRSTTASTHAYPESDPLEGGESIGASEQQECGWSFTLLGWLMYSASAVKAVDKTEHKIISSPTSESNQCKNTFPESCRENKNCNSSTFTSRLGSPLCAFLFFFSWFFPLLRPGPTPAGFLCRARQLLARQAVLSDAATLTELHHVTGLLAEHLTWPS